MSPEVDVLRLFSVGTDIVSVPRVATLLGSPGFHRWFTDAERDHCRSKTHPEQHFAGRLAAKEAAFKALGISGRGPIPWAQIEISTSASGSPDVILHGRLAELAADASVSIRVSISHCDEYATAVALTVPMSASTPSAEPSAPPLSDG